MLFSKLMAGEVYISINGAGCHLVHGRDVLWTQLAKKASLKYFPLFGSEAMHSLHRERVGLFLSIKGKWPSGP